MKSHLYGIKKVWRSIDVQFPFNTLTAFSDCENVSPMANWTEVCLTAPGSLSYKFSRENNTDVCVVTLDFRTSEDQSIPYSPIFYKAEDMDGNLFLVGLGKDYETIPVTDMNDSIGNTASNGNSTSVSVTWKCRCGRILALS